MRKKLRQSVAANKVRMWDALPWKPVDVENENLGDFEDSVFFGLEEIDGNAYKLSKDQSGVKPEPIIATERTEKDKAVEKSHKTNKAVHSDAQDAGENSNPVVGETIVTKKQQKDKKRIRDQTSGESTVDVLKAEDVSTLPPKKKRGKKEPVSEPTVYLDDGDGPEDPTMTHPKGPLPSLKALYINAPAPALKEDVQYLRDDAEWAPGLKLSSVLAQALQKLGFATPTPIQQAAIPLTTSGDTDIVGAAETGSGKTLVSCDECLLPSSYASEPLVTP
jgi:superfamily II RNA helicase